MFSVDVNSSGLQAKLRSLTDRNLKYVVVNAVNDAVKLTQNEWREELRSTLTIRNEFVIRQGAVINPFASISQGEPFAALGIAIGPLQPERFLLGLYETGGERSDVTGSKQSAVPVPGGPARPSFQSKVPTPFRYRNLDLRGKRGHRRGKRKTFEIEGLGIFERKGKAKREIEPVYIFATDQRIREVTRLVEIAQTKGSEYLRISLLRRLEGELRRKGFK